MATDLAGPDGRVVSAVSAAAASSFATEHSRLQPTSERPAAAPQGSADVLIVGAGHAGAQAAIALRQLHYDGSIAIVGDEPDSPYERPPLSKDYLAGLKTFERLQIRPPAFWAERRVRLVPGRTVLTVDADRHEVLLDDGGRMRYRHLIWAGGGQPRRLACPGHDLAGVHTVRSRADVDRLRAELGRTSRVVVIGGGYIGLECAAVLATLGKHVTVLEALDRVLARVAGEPLSRFYEAEHRAHGVDVRLATRVEALLGRGGRVTGVQFASGEVVAADLVIVGIGILPSAQPLLAAGAVGGNGVAVDADGRTSLPDVYAIGDCALHVNAYSSGFAAGESIRLESVQNAHDTAIQVARALTGAPQVLRAVPWFWSVQYDLNLQSVGLGGGHEQAVLRGVPATRSFSVVYLRGGQVIALDCVNAPKDFVQGKALVAAGTMVTAGQVADTAVALKSLLVPMVGASAIG